jgi:hypothetical protein
MKNKPCLARDGRVPKKGLGPINTHGGMFYLRHGQLIAGISRTQAQHPLDDSKMVHQPTVEKDLATPQIVPGQRCRHDDPLN